MSKSNEAVDAVKDERPFAGVHILATAMLCAAGASADELELARRLLVCDPKKDGPREAESVAGAFNRQMDAAIESCNDSAHNPTRAGRRALLARDLDRAGLVLIDRRELALLLDRGAPCRPRVPVPGVPPALNGDRLWTDGEKLYTGEHGTIAIDTAAAFDHAQRLDAEEDEETEELGAELLGGSTITVDAVPSSSAGIVGLELFQTGVTFLTHTPSFDVAATGSSTEFGGAGYPNNVND